MSTILDALRKLQRERTAESPSRDLRGSITTETPMTARRKRGGRSGWLAGAVLLLLLAGGAFWLQQSGRLSSWLHARGGPSAESDAASEAELAEAEREAANVPVDVAPEAPAVAQGEGSAMALPTQPIAPATEPTELGPPEVAPETETPEVETPEIAAERVRLEAALANARSAQEAQDAAEAAAAQKAALAEQAARDAQAAKEAQELAAAAAAAEAATAAAAVTPPAAANAPAATASTPTATANGTAAATATAKKSVTPATTAKPATSKPATATETKSTTTATAKPAARPARAPEPRYAAAGASRAPSTVFPDVRVESIRWHPIPERRVVSLQFEQQNAPDAHEGDIVAGVLIYRIDPGSVELRIGSAQRVISPEP